jgi:hypothetical protein
LQNKKPLKAKYDYDLSKAGSSEEKTLLKDAFEKKQQEVERDLDHKMFDVHLSLGVCCA